MLVLLRQLLQQQVEDGDSKRTPPDMADTLWAGWFDCTLWHCSSFVLFHEWVSVEAALLDAPAPMIDFKEWLHKHFADVRLLLLFVVEHAPEVFRLLDKVQVLVASTFRGENGEWKEYCDSITPSAPQLDVLQWWESMALCLPTMYAIARSILAHFF